MGERTHDAQKFRLGSPNQGFSSKSCSDINCCDRHSSRFCSGHCGQLSFSAEAASASALKTLQYYR